MEERFLVTGALGCIGAWVVRNLVMAGHPVAVFDLASDPHRLRLIMSPDEVARVHFITGDITDLAALEKALAETGTTNLIHLAALQVPFCRADPPLGARVNVVGTVNAFEAVKHAGLKRLVYASSFAVYGLSEEYPAGIVTDDAMLRPNNLYGVYKQANEGTARIYWQDDGIASLAFRPYTVYGPGRDQGMTSSPTKAMLAAAAGQGYHIPFGGRGLFQYADDVARAFIQASRADFTGAEVYNLHGSGAHMAEIVAAIEAAEPASRGRITFDEKPLALPGDAEPAHLPAALGKLPETALTEGVAQTVAIFKRALAEGRLKAPAAA
jgi:UDP-glucuronate 4-epimerase